MTNWNLIPAVIKSKVEIFSKEINLDEWDTYRKQFKGKKATYMPSIIRGAVNKSIKSGGAFPRAIQCGGTRV